MEKPPTREVPHSTYRYRKFGCRCDICKRCARDTRRETRLNNRLPVQPILDRFGDALRKTHNASIEGWLRDGINAYTVDKLCCSRGHHPYEVYGDAWFEPIWELDKKKAEAK